MKRASWAGFRLVLAALLLVSSAPLRAAEPQASKPKAGENSSTPSSKQEKLPTAQEILDRYAQAIGGKAAFQKHKSQHASGTVSMPAQGMNGRMDVYAARPNKLLVKLALPGVGDLNTVFNGEVGWIQSQLTGAMIMEGKMLDQIAAQADFDQALRDPSDYKSIEVLGAESFNGEECYKIKLVHQTGFESTEYFSKKTGLQTGFTATQESPLGAVTATTIVSEYKKFGDLYLPSKVSQKAAGIETVMTIEKVEFDKVDPSVFNMTDEVKAALGKPAAPDAPANAKKQGEK
jgi:hypothetical protein